MNRKLNTTPFTTEQAGITNDRPEILGGRRMKTITLPPDFDLTCHNTIVASGTVRPTTQEEFQALITEIKKQLKE